MNDNTLTDNCYLTWIVAAIGTIALVGGFIKMKGGFGPNNLRAVGITLVLTFTALIATKYQNGILTAAIGIFGSIAGYLFGNNEKKISDKQKQQLMELTKSLSDSDKLKIRDLIDD